MNSKKRIRLLIQYIAVIAVAVGIVISLYYGSIPSKYSIKAGEASPFDINANKSIPDVRATNQRAAQAAASVKDVFIVNDGILDSKLIAVTRFFNVIEAVREQYYLALENINQETSNSSASGELDLSDINNAAALLKSNLLSELNINFELNDCITLLSIDTAIFESYEVNIVNLANVILSTEVSRETLPSRVTSSVLAISSNLQEVGIDTALVTTILNTLLEPNMEYNAEATEAARTLAYNTVIDNPVLIEKGTRVISFGEIITPEKYSLLLEMGIINTGEFDFIFLGGVILLILIIIAIIVIYIQKNESKNINSVKEVVSIVISMLIPFIISIFSVKLSVLTPPVYIAAVLITAYFGFRAGLFMSLLLTFLIFPLTSFDPKFLFVAIIGSIVAGLFTLGIAKRNNYALIIISTTLSCFLASIAINILIKTPMQETFMDSAIVAISSSISVMLALGIMPLFEMIFNSVSPLRLIELSQPGSPLLSRLFIEAPGTSQHCVMVGNLAEAGAEAIGANPLIARVGAYYHDIGKLENPSMFTENQTGYNPHDDLEPKESAKIILSHPEFGLRLARKYRLPTIISKMIYEHHGTSKQMFFLRKAQEINAKQNIDAPDNYEYMYKTARPSFKESGILMLADTVEAAMKSTGITDIEKAEELIRKLIRHKIEEDQLMDSDLSFKDVENIIQAFLHIYSGHFRIRVRYPDDIADKE